MPSTPLTRRSFGLTAFSVVSATRLASAFSYPPVARGDIAHWHDVHGLQGLEQAFEYLANTPLAHRPLGRTDIDGDRMYITISESAPLSLTEGLFETHRKYVDIHFLISGSELIGTAPAATLKPVAPYDPKSEAQNFSIPAHYERIILAPNQFAVFRPGQTHFPGRSPNGGHTPIRKAVVKVKV